MKDSFLNNNRISCLMSVRKNGKLIYFLKSPLWNLQKTTKKNKGHNWELLGIIRRLVNPVVIMDEIFWRLLLQQLDLSAVEHQHHVGYLLPFTAAAQVKSGPAVPWSFHGTRSPVLKLQGSSPTESEGWAPGIVVCQSVILQK